MVTQQTIPTGNGFQDLAGQRFGQLTALAYAGRSKDSRSLWRCCCTCGAEVTVRAKDLKRKHALSCGCLFRKMRKADFYDTVKKRSRCLEHRRWGGMLTRCYNPNHIGYAYYGGRGIRVCDRWQGEEGFANFLADMGPCPPRRQLDRIDNNGNYEPGNCRWATLKQQSRNRRIARLLTCRGVTKTLAEWAEETGIQRGTIHGRLRRGWTVEQALES